MDQEEFIICDDATIKKEFQEPLSVEEVPLNDPLAPQTDADPETEINIKQERISSWSKSSEVENEEDQEVIDDSHTDNIPADIEVASYPENQREKPHEEPSAKSSMAPFISSNCLQSSPPTPSPPRSPFDAVALNCRIASEEAPASSASNLQIDQNDSSNASEGHDGLGNISPPHEPESAESHFPEIIYVDSDSENEQRNSQVTSLNNSESGVWSKNIEVTASSGVIFKLDNINEERVLQDADIANNSSSEKVKAIKSSKKTKTKKRKLLKHSETSSSSQPILPTGEPVAKQLLIGLGEMYTTVQGQQGLPTSQQIVPPGQQAIAQSQPVLSLNQQNSLQNQQAWTPIHQLLALSSQILSQQQSIAPVQSSQLVSQQQSITPVQGSQLLNQLSVTPSQSSQLLTQQPVTSLQGPQLLSQQSPRPPQPILTSLLKTTAQSKVVPPNSQKFGLAQSAKKCKLTGVNASETEVRRTTAKPQAEVNTGNNIASESELMNLKHKMTVQELKLRLRNRKVKAELEESELKMKMEASMQELSNKKLKHEILLTKLQFYTKLCAAENL